MLHTFFSSLNSSRKCNARIYLLAFLWILGLTFGGFIALHNEDYILPMMRTAVTLRVSIVNLLVLQLIPLVISALAVYFSIPLLIYPLCTFKAIFLGFILGSLGRVFGSAGWLIRLLYLFTDTIMTPLLLWYWFKHISGTKLSINRDNKILFSAFSITAMLEYFAISPFLVVLMNR